MLADEHKENIGILGIMRPGEKKKRHHTCSQAEKRWRAESLVRWGGYLIDEAVWERCKRVQDCGPGGMLCLWQR